MCFRKILCSVQSLNSSIRKKKKSSAVERLLLFKITTLLESVIHVLIIKLLHKSATPSSVKLCTIIYTQKSLACYILLAKYHIIFHAKNRKNFTHPRYHTNWVVERASTKIEMSF